MGIFVDNRTGDIRPIGILGGTFDPIHHGHLTPALEIATALDFVQLRLLPLGLAVHRPQPLASAAHRVQMCRLAAGEYPFITVDEREVRSPQGSYTVFTLESLRSELGPQQPLCFLMGADAFHDFTEWEGWQRILQLAHIVVMPRPGYSEQQRIDNALQPYLSTSLTGVAGNVLMYEVAGHAISSTKIRHCLRRQSGETEISDSRARSFVHSALHENVREYIFQQQLYL